MTEKRRWTSRGVERVRAPQTPKEQAEINRYNNLVNMAWLALRIGGGVAVLLGTAEFLDINVDVGVTKAEFDSGLNGIWQGLNTIINTPPEEWLVELYQVLD